MKDAFQWHRRAQDAFGQGYRPRLGVDHFPTHLRGAKGCHVFDPSGKKYLDFTSGNGANLLGAGNERITAAMAVELGRGALFPIQSHVEVETAEKVKELFPFCQAVRFYRTKAEAMAAAKTGKPASLFVRESWEPSMIAPAIAADRKHGFRILIDETVTCLRYRKYSMTACYGLDPDLVILGGALGGGMPLYAVGGKYSVMLAIPETQEPVDTLTLTSAKQGMTMLQTRHSVDDLWLRGKDFLDRFNAIWPEKVRLDGYAVHARLAGDPKATQSFKEQAVKAGLLFGDEVFFSFHMIDEYQSALDLCRDILVKMRVQKEFQ